MTGPQSFFRQEAIQYQAGPGERGDIVRVTPAWTVRLYRVLLALVVAGVALIFAVRTNKVVSAPAVIDGENRTFAALVPSAAAADVRIGQRVRLEVKDARGGAVTGLATRAEAANDANAALWGFDSFQRRAVLVTGELVSPGSNASPSRRAQCRARVVASDRFAQVLVRDLTQMVVQGGAR